MIVNTSDSLSKSLLFSAALMLPALYSCGNKSERHADTPATAVAPEEFHADNDIAMTLASITDALRVKEPLDTNEYNFNGILTDGQGHPLYTSTRGLPGEWDVDVITPSSVVIRNEDIGDLLSDDLQSYITNSLGITSHDIIYSRTADDDHEPDITVYDANGCYLRIETRQSTASNGIEGPLMRILATTEAPRLD